VPIETAGKRSKTQGTGGAAVRGSKLKIATVAWQVGGNIRTALLEFVAAGEREALLKNQVGLQEKEILKTASNSSRSRAMASNRSSTISDAREKPGWIWPTQSGRRADAHARLAEQLASPVRALAKSG